MYLSPLDFRKVKRSESKDSFFSAVYGAGVAKIPLQTDRLYLFLPPGAAASLGSLTHTLPHSAKRR